MLRSETKNCLRKGYFFFCVAILYINSWTRSVVRSYTLVRGWYFTNGKSINKRRKEKIRTFTILSKRSTYFFRHSDCFWNRSFCWDPHKNQVWSCNTTDIGIMTLERFMSNLLHQNTAADVVIVRDDHIVFSPLTSSRAHRTLRLSLSEDRATSPRFMDHGIQAMAPKIPTRRPSMWALTPMISCKAHEEYKPRVDESTRRKSIFERIFRVHSPYFDIDCIRFWKI